MHKFHILLMKNSLSERIFYHRIILEIREWGFPRNNNILQFQFPILNGAIIHVDAYLQTRRRGFPFRSVHRFPKQVKHYSVSARSVQSSKTYCKLSTASPFVTFDSKAFYFCIFSRMISISRSDALWNISSLRIFKEQVSRKYSEPPPSFVISSFPSFHVSNWRSIDVNITMKIYFCTRYTHVFVHTWTPQLSCFVRSEIIFRHLKFAFDNNQRTVGTSTFSSNLKIQSLALQKIVKKKNRPWFYSISTKIDK